jgi:hypothetical protein
MPRDPVQFQKGLSDADFDHLYGTESQCRETLFKWRWPEGFTCPICGGRKHCVIETRAMYQCPACRAQISLTAGMIFRSTKLPLKTWFRAVYHLQSKVLLAGLVRQAGLGCSQNSAIPYRLLKLAENYA